MNTENIKVVVEAIANYNNRIGNSKAWKVVPELCYLNNGEFIEEVYKKAVSIGVKDTSQSIEECGAVGQSFIVDKDAFISLFK